MRNIRDPFLLKHVGATLFAAAAACLLSYFFIDVSLAQYFEHISCPLKIASKVLTDMIDPAYQYFLWPILYFAFRFIWKNAVWADRCLLLVMSIPLTNLFVEIIKVVLGRARPKLLFSSHLFGFTGFSITDAYHSFPSGHACTIGAICGAFICFYPKAALPITLLAFPLAFTRVILSKHYLSDIIAGVIIGILISQFIYILKSRSRHGTPL